MKKGARVFLAAVALAACVGFGVYLSSHQSPNRPVAPPTQRTPSTVRPAVETTHVKIYRVAMKNNQPELRVVDAEVEVGKNPPEIALRRLIEQGDKADLANPIPGGTRLLGLTVKNGLATVDLSREFRDNFEGGSTEEGLTIGAILRTLAQFPEIKRVQLLVEGKTIDSLGHLDISGPLGVSWVGSEYGGEN